METKSADCLICASPLAERLNAKKNWTSIRLLRWAELRGLNIDEKILTEHLESHVNGNGDSAIKKPAVKDRIGPITQEPIKPNPETAKVTPADEQLLNLIIQQIYDDVKSSKLELKVEHAFKAIEIKQKLAESGNVENLLLELLNEIRSQELAK